MAPPTARPTPLEDSTLRTVFKTLTPAERALFEERAGVMEFDGGLSRDFANREALWDTVRQRTHAR